MDNKEVYVLWFVLNTSLTDQQIAYFVEFELWEVMAIRRGFLVEVSEMVNPIIEGYITPSIIKKAEEDPEFMPQFSIKSTSDECSSDKIINKIRNKIGKRYISKSKRQYIDNYIVYMLLKHPQIPIKNIAKLLRTTSIKIKNILQEIQENKKTMQNARCPLTDEVITAREIESANE